MREKLEALIAEWREESARSHSFSTDEEDEVREAELRTEGEVLQDCANELAAILAADTGGWRNMDSAPKDGTRVLLAERCLDGWYFETGRWVDAESPSIAGWYPNPWRTNSWQLWRPIHHPTPEATAMSTALAAAQEE